MSTVNLSTNIIDITTDVADIAAAGINTAADSLFIRDASASGAAQFKKITFAEASTLFGGSVSLVDPGGVDTWAAYLSSNPPTASGQQLHLRRSTGDYGRWISDGSAWQFIEGRRIGASSPLSSITPWGVGQIFLAISSSYGSISVGSSTVWQAIGSNSSTWKQLA